MKRRMITKTDLLLILPLLLAALLAVLFLAKGRSGARRAVVTYNGETALEIDLDALTGTETRTVGNVEIEFSPEGARIVSSPCPDHICVKTGLLTKLGDVAACVPERVAVKIEAERSDVDAVAY